MCYTNVRTMCLYQLPLRTFGRQVIFHISRVIFNWVATRSSVADHIRHLFSIPKIEILIGLVLSLFGEFERSGFCAVIKRRQNKALVVYQ